MFISSKRLLLLSCLVTLRIFKTIIIGFHFVVVNICNELELALKGEESTTFNRAETYSFNDRGRTTTPLQAPDSVNQNRNPATIDDGISFSTTDRSVKIKLTDKNLVIPNVSDTFIIPTNGELQRPVSVTRENDPNKHDSSDPPLAYSVLDPVNTNEVPVDPSQVLDNIELDYLPMTPHCKNFRFESIPDGTCSVQDATQKSSSIIGNIAPERSADELSKSDENLDLKLNEQDNAKIPDGTCSVQDATQKWSSIIGNIAPERSADELSRSDESLDLKSNEQDNAKISEIDPSNLEKPILTQRKSKQSWVVVTSCQRNVTGKSCDTTDRKQTDNDSEQKVKIENPPTLAFSKHVDSINSNRIRRKIDRTTVSPTACLTKDDDTTNQAAPSQNEQLALTKNTKTLSYLDCLKEIIPIIHTIEYTLIVLLETCFNKSPLNDVSCNFVDSELAKILKAFENVDNTFFSNQLPVNVTLPVNYTVRMAVITGYLREDIQMSLNPKTRPKISFCMKKLTSNLEKARKILFGVDAECMKLGMQMGRLKPTTKQKTKIIIKKK